MTIKVISERKGQHVESRIFAGEDKDHLELAGYLLFRLGEWQLFCAALRMGAEQTDGRLELICVGDGQVVETAK